MNRKWIFFQLNRSKPRPRFQRIHKIFWMGAALLVPQGLWCITRLLILPIRPHTRLCRCITEDIKFPISSISWISKFFNFLNFKFLEFFNFSISWIFKLLFAYKNFRFISFYSLPILFHYQSFFAKLCHNSSAQIKNR